MRIALLLAAFLYALLGTGHAVLALRDVRHERSFVPTDPSVLQTLKNTGVSAMPGATFWRAWLGFNLSHSLGLLQFAGALVVLALRAGDEFSDSGVFVLAGLVVAVVYLAVAGRFFFRPPTVVAALGLTCLATAFALSLA
ncbi:hypothetical protein Kfla_5837 [Kribbella flavida DSM 17836]|uniref:Transmembrane protein n=1 Tax=Kribbella flavida (strain DSM 17836 / JCM 10339 / NBRC 14399) TaxID=479435 RepID=D2PQD9_KRIFD|nr:hypothetical protein [Kribbella flavida]ADB34841.1 hypothetical protein Kfla_5837 [Kribbella flavida DSM 17836]